LHLAERTSDALEAITEADALIERFENCYWCAELHRLREMFLVATGADETRIEAAFNATISYCKRAELGFIGEARVNNLRGISQPEKQRVKEPGF